MPHQASIVSARQKSASKAERARRILAGASSLRDDSDDELANDDLDWEWLYDSGKSRDGEQDDELSDDSGDDESVAATTPKKRRIRHTRNASRWNERQIIGVKKGQVEFRIGDCVVLKTHGANDPWVGIIAKLEDDLTNEKAVNILCEIMQLYSTIPTSDISRVCIREGHKKQVEEKIRLSACKFYLLLYTSAC